MARGASVCAQAGLGALRFLRRAGQCREAAILAALKALSPPEDPEDGDTGGSAPPQGKPEKANRTLHTSLRRMMGVDLTAIPTIGPETALVIACEIGPTLSAFPTMQHFCSWLGLAPGTRISGDRKLRSKGRTPVNRVGQALRMAAMSARRSQSYIGAKHRSRLARMDTRVAIKATAHELARMVYLMLSRGQPFVERGIECFEEDAAAAKSNICIARQGRSASA